ncbi:hypothetical protein EAE96_002111 [Botrytis aclada]|nr:hypothetical protein EAE96_002111 [Botrytis aclada]
MSTLWRRSQVEEVSGSAYTSAHSFGGTQEPWQENLRERGSWGEMAGENVAEDATSGGNQGLPAHEDVPTDNSPAETPNPLTEVSELSESDGGIRDERAMQSRRKREEIARAKKGKGRETEPFNPMEHLVPSLPQPNRDTPSSQPLTGEARSRNVYERIDNYAQGLNQAWINLGAAGIHSPGVPNPIPVPEVQPGAREKKFYVYKAPHNVSYIKPWTWRFRRSKPAPQDGTTATVGEGHYYTYKKRPKSMLFWKWNWQGPKPISWIPIYPSYHPERDDPELKIFIAYKCGHRFPTRVISAPTWTASSPSFLFSPFSPWTPNTPTYPRSGSTSGHPHIRPLPSLKIETLRAAARQEGVKNIISPENYICPNCFIWRQWFAGLFMLILLGGIFTWYFSFIWPYTWWATTENGDLVPKYTIVTQFDIHRGVEFHVRQAIGGFVVAILKWVVAPGLFCLGAYASYKQGKKAAAGEHLRQN